LTEVECVGVRYGWQSLGKSPQHIGGFPEITALNWVPVDRKESGRNRT
jgi:hypothetical protein